MDNFDNLDEVEEPLSKKNASIDKLTLELLTSKTKYNKYLSKNEPEKFKKYDQFQQKLKKYGHKIKNLTESLIMDYEMPVTNDVNECFYNYANVLIRHFEMRELETKSGGGNQETEESDDDVLFKDLSDEDDRDTKASEKINKYDALLGNTSYWGAPVRKI